MARCTKSGPPICRDGKARRAHRCGCRRGGSAADGPPEVSRTSRRQTPPGLGYGSTRFRSGAIPGRLERPAGVVWPLAAATGLADLRSVDRADAGTRAGRPLRCPMGVAPSPPDCGSAEIHGPDRGHPRGAPAASEAEGSERGWALSLTIWPSVPVWQRGLSTDLTPGFPKPPAACALL